MIWAKIEETPLKEDIIFLPQTIALQLIPATHICFGQKRIWAQVRSLPSFLEGEGETFDNPQVIQMTTSLWQKLLMVKSIHLQMTFIDGEITFGPVIGLLLGNKIHKHNCKQVKRISDRLGVYPQIGGIIFAFTTETINWEKESVCGLYYNYFNGKWKYGEFPLPTVIYRRYFHTDIEQLKQLKEVTGGKLFNSVRFTKWDLYKKLKNDKEMEFYLPETKKVKNFNDVKEFFDKYEKVILKPTYLSRGRGICIIESIKGKGKKLSINNKYSTAGFKVFNSTKENKNNYNVHDYLYSNISEIYTFSSLTLKTFLEDANFFVTPYLIQPLLSLAKVDGNPFDVRIVMQRDKYGEWAHSGIECRIASQGAMITNISRGGYALSLKETLQQAFGLEVDAASIEEEILWVCHQFCRVMDETGEHYAEFGVDVAIDINKRIWFIEANVFPSFKGFKKLDYETYLQIRYRSLLYATQLAGFAREDY